MNRGFKRLIFPSIIFAVFAFSPLFSRSESERYYGKTDPLSYVTGRFNPSQSDLFVNLKNTDIPCDGKSHYLRKEAAQALALMIRDFRSAYPDARLWITSSTRSFYDQKHIWEAKWYGRRLVNGKKLNQAVKSPLERGKAILAYSSMPGTSRHHWGTDVDFNVLTDKYYTSGKGRTLYRWLKENGSKYGFCQPYNEGRSKGYLEEKWHWSYTPLSAKFLRDWNGLYSEMRFSEKDFAGAAVCWHLSQEYVNAVNLGCE